MEIIHRCRSQLHVNGYQHVLAIDVIDASCQQTTRPDLKTFSHMTGMSHRATRQPIIRLNTRPARSLGQLSTSQRATVRVPGQHPQDY
ncbi:hypothetical protein RRG08_060012 [Elysia crispata]|uniref:Uncharacterized protein n=1 Tax=Elysia crispata TaxID=231223 RepID=A0AAE1CXQ9_9GAST|nr:hypothetical protein RRG08_060012 [Elysia crispata]